MRNASELLSGLTVQSVAGEPRPVEELWTEAPAVVGFVRHFG